MKNFTKHWNRSTQVRKQRKYRYHAPLHIRQKLMSVHLSPILRKKYGRRNVAAKVGDTVKIMGGQFAKKEGKVEKVNLKHGRVYVTGLEIIKKDGTKVLVPFQPSKLMLLELNLTDKQRKNKLESALGQSGKSERPPQQKAVKQENLQQGLKRGKGIEQNKGADQNKSAGQKNDTKKGKD